MDDPWLLPTSNSLQATQEVLRGPFQQSILNGSQQRF